MPRILLMIAYVLAIAVWTWLLLKPNPVPTFIAESLMEDIKFLLGKSLHATMYAALAAIGLWLFPNRWHKTLLLLLIGHAVLSETGQHLGKVYFSTNRTGSVMDVLIDCFGVWIGWSIWRWRSRNRLHSQSVAATSSPSTVI
jgi:hypothetical protein